MFLSFWGGYEAAKPDPGTAVSVKKKIDSLTHELHISIAKTEMFSKKAESFEKQYKHSDSLAVVINKRRINQAIAYAKKIEQVRTFNIYQVGSFLVNKYPTETYKSKTDSSAITKTIAVEGWRVRAAEVDIVRGDSLASVTQSQDSTINQLNTSIVDRDSAIVSLHDVIGQQAISLKDSKQLTAMWEQQTSFWMDKANKYKRQRNGIIVGVGAVVVGGLILFLKP